ncbi:Chromatin assembly factor 1 subunit B [Trichinella pseudospiralis]|uniref:Chromatin assembly factor 1 subunit B n=1 Tax=Trichinella pseudospiralis TaxID=6337 RepID=A0A0V1KDY9_TRIPS|nr:Chromatin assembly factor 1 subunit B [Trichinella pseudospiralis]KRZ32305.1 Chromatin assembly factor 1 subunit B [Trichinella pseudospiralis]KRZ45410.1 Chromatin assembly factor 1 subunit B [Trichinella pseudospiralis]
MKAQILEIVWHSFNAVLSVDVQRCESNYRVLTSSSEGEVRIWKLEVDNSSKADVEFLCNLKVSDGSVNVIRFSPQGDLFASGDYKGCIMTWNQYDKEVAGMSENDDLPPNQEHWRMSKSMFCRNSSSLISDIVDLEWREDGALLIAATMARSVFIWNPKTGHLLKQCLIEEGKFGLPCGVAVSPFADYFVTMVQWKAILLTRISNGKLLARINSSLMPCINPESTEPQDLFLGSHFQSLKRKPAFSPDGRLLIVPAGFLKNTVYDGFTSYIFASNNFSTPSYVLPIKSESFLVVFCPVWFTLKCEKPSLFDLPYRFVFAVFCKEEVYFYDTESNYPFGFARGLHYGNITDANWSQDGRFLIISSWDGYCSIIFFEENELGTPLNEDEIKACKDEALRELSKTTAVEGIEIMDITSSTLKENLSLSTVKRTATNRSNRSGLLLLSSNTVERVNNQRNYDGIRRNIAKEFDELPHLNHLAFDLSKLSNSKKFDQEYPPIEHCPTNEEFDKYEDIISPEESLKTLPNSLFNRFTSGEWLKPEKLIDLNDCITADKGILFAELLELTKQLEFH